jgi:DNA-binding CsgD family transcriptional regulator
MAPLHNSTPYPSQGLMPPWPLTVIHRTLQPSSALPSGMSEEWKNILASHPIIQLLRPDFVAIVALSGPASVIYQQNINLDFGTKDVSLFSILNQCTEPDRLYMKRVDQVLLDFARECATQPFDFMCRIFCHVLCPATGQKIFMRTHYIGASDPDGKPSYGVICFHDVSAIVSSVRSHQCDVTFAPDKSYLCHEVYKRLNGLQPKFPQCTTREKEILRCLHMGMSSKLTADALFISKTTVDTHRQNMLRKWNVPNTAALLKIACENGWV